ncbi:MAG: YscO family type III secretion system apparatus protein [Pseudomonadota bacterium]
MSAYQQAHRQMTQLHDVKSRRLNIREKSLKDAQKNLLQAIQHVEKTEEILKEFVDYRRQEKDKLYAEVEDSSVTLRDMTVLQEKLAQLKQKQLSFEHDHSQAANEKNLAEKALEEARNAWRLAQKAVQKADQMVGDAHSIFSKESERLVEIENEDKTASVHSRFL